MHVIACPLDDYILGTTTTTAYKDILPLKDT